MPVTNIIAQIDAEIIRLQQAKTLLSGGVRANAVTSRTTAGGAGATTPPKRKGKRRMSAEARARIAEAQRKRWAAQRAKAK